MNRIAKKMLLERLDGKRGQEYRPTTERRTRGEFGGYRGHERGYRDDRGAERYSRSRADDRRRYDDRYDSHDGREGRYRRSDHDDWREDEYEEYDEDESEDESLKIKAKDIPAWAKHMENADGSDGAKFPKEQVRAIAEQEGIAFDKFTHEELFVTANMMYSDYCLVARKYGIDRPDFYVCMAKAFLDDKDFDGEPSEKLALYYYCIVDSE